MKTKTDYNKTDYKNHRRKRLVNSKIKYYVLNHTQQVLYYLKKYFHIS